MAEMINRVAVRVRRGAGSLWFSRSTPPDQ